MIEERRREIEEERERERKLREREKETLDDECGLSSPSERVRS